MPQGVIKIVDVKCPNSGEPDTFNPENLEALDSADEVKFVLSDHADYEFARDFVIRHNLASRVQRRPIFAGIRKAATGSRDTATLPARSPRTRRMDVGRLKSPPGCH